jgi:hypothetical protein
MAGKRKIIRKRSTGRKTRAKKNHSEEQEHPQVHNDDSEFTKEEEEEPLSIHIQPSPKKSPGNYSRSSRTKKNDSTSANEDEDDDTEEGAVIGSNNDGDEDEGDNYREEEHKNKYEVRQRVLARDEDGILYYANIRRTLYGINHQKSISRLGLFDLAPEELMEQNKKNNTAANDKNTNDNGEKRPNSTNDDEKSQENTENEWYYFVHYEGWKTLWDRWVSETDILEVIPENIERMKEISKTHKGFQLEFKEKTKKRKIQNGGLFLQQWKQRLDALNRRWDEKLEANKSDTAKNTTTKGTKQSKNRLAAANKRKKKAAKKKNERSPHEVLRDRSNLAVQSCLSTRQSSHIQAIPLSFGLKRILVEDWENLNNSNFAAAADKSNRNDDAASEEQQSKCDMVHVLPAKVTIRDALSLYLREKGISWDGKPKHELRLNTSSNGEIANHTNEAPTQTDQSSKPDPETPPAAQDNEQPRPDSSVVDEDPAKPKTIASESAKSLLPDETKSVKQETDDFAAKDGSDLDPKHGHEDDGVGKGISIQLIKEWTDMANGIVLYFEQALLVRLLYPSEVSQLLVLEDTLADDMGGENANKIETMPLKVDIYGCEHLLRLLAAIPRILDQQLKETRRRKLERKQNGSKSTTTNEPATETENEDAAADQDDDAFAEIGSMILAKLQDLSRFLQKNQSALFRSMYRKKNEQEIKRDMKIQKRQERRLKSAAAAAAASQNTVQNSPGQKGETTEVGGA